MASPSNLITHDPIAGAQGRRFWAQSLTLGTIFSFFYEFHGWRKYQGPLETIILDPGTTKLIKMIHEQTT